MGDIILVYCLQNILIFSLIFWGLTWGGEFFFKKKNHLTKKQFYECGYKATSEMNIQININFTLVCIFLILYDVEFLFLYPVFFNMLSITMIQFFILIFFLFMIVLSLYYDWQLNALNWQI